MSDSSYLSDSDMAALLDDSPFSAAQKVSGARGIFFSTSDSAGMVFCRESNLCVHVPLEVAYSSSRKIKSFGELCQHRASRDPVDVCVDAVLSDDALWVATLMWTGERPPRPHVNESESVFREVLGLVACGASTGSACNGGAAHKIKAGGALENSCSAPSFDLTVLSYPCSKGIITNVQRNSAVCEVQELEGCREVDFSCFYKDGNKHVGPMDIWLRENDIVYLDYLVGTTSAGTEEVFCRLAWQGSKPQLFVDLLTPEEFRRRLKDREASLSSSCRPTVSSEPQSHRLGALPKSTCTSATAEATSTVDQAGSCHLPSEASCPQQQTRMSSLNGEVAYVETARGQNKAAHPTVSVDVLRQIVASATETCRTKLRAQMRDCVRQIVQASTLHWREAAVEARYSQ